MVPLTGSHRAGEPQYPGDLKQGLKQVGTLIIPCWSLTYKLYEMYYTIYQILCILNQFNKFF